MIMIKGKKEWASYERVFESYTQEVMVLAEQLEASGFIVSLERLPAEIKTLEDVAYSHLEKLDEMYENPAEQLN